jgi:DNA-directed RNA polymerase specialized sigma24 family protein
MLKYPEDPSQKNVWRAFMLFGILIVAVADSTIAAPPARSYNTTYFHGEGVRGAPAMSSAGSVTAWLARLKTGDAAAAQKLWERYFHRLLGLARKKLKSISRRAADEEDVALSALASFFRGLDRARFPRLNDRGDLWSLLVVLTARKASHRIDYEQRQKRGGGATRGESALDNPAGSAVEHYGINQVVDDEPTPDFAAEVAEQCHRLLECLNDVDLRQVALWKMEGYTNAEIAAKLNCAVVTVERRLRLIRTIWKKEMDHERNPTDG